MPCPLRGCPASLRATLAGPRPRKGQGKSSRGRLASEFIPWRGSRMSFHRHYKILESGVLGSLKGSLVDSRPRLNDHPRLVANP